MREIKECVILAAGLSSRMGGWKMMLPWKNATVLDQVINNALVFCQRIVLVTGYRAQELHVRYGSDPCITLAWNPHYRQGMLSSVRCGVAQTCGQHFFLALGDMPGVPADIFSTLWEQRCESCLVPVSGTLRGHPVLLPAAMRTRILAAEKHESLKSLMVNFGRKEISVDSESIHQDLDTPRQYLQLLTEETGQHACYPLRPKREDAYCPENPDHTS